MQKVILGLLLGGIAFVALSFMLPVKKEGNQPQLNSDAYAKKEQIHWLTLKDAELALKDNENRLIDLYTIGVDGAMDKKTAAIRD
jgi:hypothetical protein